MSAEEQQGPATAGPPPGYRLKGPAHAHLDAPCAPSCYEPDTERHRREHQGKRIWTADEKAARGNDGAAYAECRWTDFAERGETNGLHWHEVQPPTPELEKQAQAIRDGAHQIGEFLDHLRERGLHLAQFGDNDQLYLVSERPEATIAAFFGIDLDKIEAERRALLRYVREQQP